MKKYLCLLVIFFILTNDLAIAAGILPHPQINSPAAINVPSSAPMKTPAFKSPTVLDSSPSQTKFQFAPEKPLEVKTSTDIQTYKKISLPEAIDYAMKHNLEIQSTRIEIPKARNDIKTAGRLKNPYILSFFNLGKAATDNPNTVGMIFPIEIAKRGVRKNLARSNLELIKCNVTFAELNLRLDVRQAYVDLVAAKSTLKILSEQRILLQELLHIAKRKYEVGAGPEMDYIHAKMTLNQLLIEENTARTAVFVARYAFNLLLESTNFDSLEDYLPEQNEFISLLTPDPAGKMPDFDKIYEIASQKRLDLKIARRDIDVAQKNLTVVIRQRVPDIELGGGYMFVTPALATSSTLAQGVFGAVNVTNIPLLYQYTPEIRNARLIVEQKELAYRGVEHHALMTLHSAYDEFLTAQANLNYYTDILLAESRQFLNMAKKSYTVGKSSMTDFVFIQQSYKTIVMGYTQALANYYDAWVEVLREVNDEELKLNG